MRVIYLLVLVACTGTIADQAIAESCRPAEETREVLLSIVAMYAKDSAYAENAHDLELPLVSATDIQVIDDPRLCAQAAEAYRQVSGRPEGVSGRVQVVRMNSVYVVFDPDFAYNPKVPAQFFGVFDRKWRKLATFGSAG